MSKAAQRFKAVVSKLRLKRAGEIRLVRDRFTPRGAYTSHLSKFCSKTSYENLYREGFPAAQQFFHTNLAARRCYWHNNRYTIVRQAYTITLTSRINA
ncbi:hypothetical protein Taro_055768 [Colocasia esculenta]|uniref:Uncharacterized protein n=1 Tax=Colocasia esculenta TaxID=4460 RepID=A0A843XUD1_COLES|nr:hypothetical protein [Colocasia esculenta]